MKMSYWPRLPFVIFLIGLFTAVVVECRWFKNGLIFYDLTTKHVILPPTVTVQRGRSMRFTNIPLFAKLGQPCTCKGLMCGCCAGLEVREYNFNQKMCANVTFVPEKEEALLDVFLNEMSRARYGISARNPSPICVPIMMPLPMAACIQMSDVGLKGDNLHMCMDFVMRLHTTDAMELHFNCLSMGRDGIQYLDKNGQPVLPRAPADQKNNDDEEEYYDDSNQSKDSDQKSSHSDEKDEDSYAEGEESGDGPIIGTTKVETEEYEYVDDVLDNEHVEEEITEKVRDHRNTTELSTEENYVSDNLIRVYETV